ncbi:MAG: 7-cyano-7-deazaguanine synthase QueC [Candidatus Goldbacteria bacterium]|nr:7-cyano-7-deazaguanine synthase QueC [Candidatus Goldiibacteriota bacterium]
MKEKAVVLLSGGQDSTTSLFWAKKKFGEITAVSFDYGQRHKIELNYAKKIAGLADVKHKIFRIKEFKEIKSSALVDKNISLNKSDGINKNLPSSFVPGRNVLFLTVAAAFAYTQNIKNIVTGVSQADYSGYPDCRERFIKSIEKTLSLGMDFKFRIHTPLIYMKKKDVVLLAKKLDILPYLKWTHTCYSGIRPGCGKCPACKLRKKGFEEAGIKDPIFED